MQFGSMKVILLYEYTDYQHVSVIDVANSRAILTHYKYICILALTTLKIAT